MSSASNVVAAIWPLEPDQVIYLHEGCGMGLLLFSTHSSTKTKAAEGIQSPLCETREHMEPAAKHNNDPDFHSGPVHHSIHQEHT